MKRVPSIDFCHRPSQPWWGWGLAATALALLAASGHGVWLAQQQLQAEHGRLQLAQAAQAPKAALSAADRMLLAQARSVAGQLNAPWDQLLAVFEEHSMPRVGLLKLEPDAKTALVKVTGQSGDTDALIVYVAALEADPRLAEVLLVAHQVERDAAGQPVRFVLSAGWRLTPVATPLPARLAKEGS